MIRVALLHRASGFRDAMRHALTFGAGLTLSIFEEDFDRIRRLVVLDFPEAFQSQNLLAKPQRMRCLVPGSGCP